MTALICTPLRVEHAALHGRVAVPVVRTGRGPSAALRFANPGNRPLLIAGVAGALSPDLRPGDLVVSSELGTEDGPPIPSPGAALLAAALRRHGLTVHVGPIVTSDRVVHGAAARDRLAEATPTLDRSRPIAVDTESAYLARQGAPGQAIALRAIVDTPAAPLIRIGTARRGLIALRALRDAAPAIDEWAQACADRQILLAQPRSFCAGVDRAIEIVERALELHGPPVYVRRQIVHNVHVVQDLQRRGAVFVHEVEDVPRGALVVLAAHGVAPAVRRAAQARELQVIDATCPLVAKVHGEVRRFADRDHTVFLIGHHDHEEVEGTRGEAPQNVVVVADPAHAARVTAPDPQRVSYVMQTTLAVEEAEQTAAVLRERFPALTAPRKDDICYATTNRQQAVRAIAQDSDVVLVLGSQNSSNSHRLAEVAANCGARAYLVDDAGQVDLRWLAGSRRVGITAGASAPPKLVDDLVQCLSSLGRADVREITVVDEDVRFTLPREVS